MHPMTWRATSGRLYRGCGRGALPPAPADAPDAPAPIAAATGVGRSHGEARRGELAPDAASV
jgi:hypothetical protein